MTTAEKLFKEACSRCERRSSNSSTCSEFKDCPVYKLKELKQKEKVVKADGWVVPPPPAGCI
jgi:hypothetical protein